jgi:hypothetical protein
MIGIWERHHGRYFIHHLLLQLQSCVQLGQLPRQTRKRQLQQGHGKGAKNDVVIIEA